MTDDEGLDVAIKRMLYEGGKLEAELDTESMGDALALLFASLVHLLDSTEGAFNFLSMDVKPAGEFEAAQVVVFRPGRVPSFEALRRAVAETHPD